MADTIRNIGDLKSDEAILDLNAMRLDLLKLKAGAIFHADASVAIATANATDLPSSIALLNACQAAYNAHIASACNVQTGQGSHLAADATNPSAAAAASDLGTAETLANDLKSKYNAHRALVASHGTADGTNIVTAAAATDQGTTNTLANDIKTQLNAHFAAAFAFHATKLVSP